MAGGALGAYLPDLPARDAGRHGSTNPLPYGIMARMDVLSAPERALAIMAHPDDVDFACGGTIATLIAAGTTVAYCIITDGDAGGFDATVPRSEIPGIRRREQVAAGAVLGVADVRFLGYRDGRLAVSHELRRDIARVIRQVRPNLVISQSPERNYRRMYASHPDHMAAGEAALQAVYPDSRNPFAHPELLQSEGLEAWYVDQVWIAGQEPFDHAVDIGDVFERKVAAIRAHESQVAHLSELEQNMRGWAAGTAMAAGLPAERLAEGYTVLDTRA